MTDDQRQRWSAGVPLSEAAERYVHPIRRRRTKRSGPGIEQLGTLEGEALFRATMKAAQEALSKLSASSEAVQSRREALLELIRSGLLDALGFTDGAPEAPQVIPPGWLRAERVNWKRSEIKGDGVIFGLVRVVDPEPEPPAATDAQRNPGGRPSRGDDIRTTAVRLLKRGVPILGMNAKDARRVIIEELGLGDPLADHKGYGEETIRRVLNKLRRTS